MAKGIHLPMKIDKLGEKKEVNFRYKQWKISTK